MPPVHLVVPGKLDQSTGGYIYMATMVAELRARGTDVVVHELPGVFPLADQVAKAAAAATLAAIPVDTVVVIDGLALPAFADLIDRCAARLRCVAVVHHKLARETGLAPAARQHLEVLESRLLRQMRGVIATGPHTAIDVAAMGVPRERVIVVQPGTARGVAPRRRGAGRRRLIAVATLTPRKGQLLLIGALAGLRRLAWRLDCIGSCQRDRAYAARVRAAVVRHRLSARVRLVGEVPPGRLSWHYRRADLFVLPSYHEGYGMAFAEAIAYGLPVIGTTAGAIPRTVPRGAGVLVRPGDANSLRRALSSLLATPHRRLRLARAARAAARQLPGWHDQARRFAEALARLSRE
ncbi:MAG: glycosyltransferase family 4 protein [Proteobacteria bacterium]|nr:glycosyltransferase family 4 protein [Pseudomonadota bacterium]